MAIAQILITVLIRSRGTLNEEVNNLRLPNGRTFLNVRLLRMPVYSVQSTQHGAGANFRWLPLSGFLPESDERTAISKLHESLELDDCVAMLLPFVEGRQTFTLIAAKPN